MKNNDITVGCKLYVQIFETIQGRTWPTITHVVPNYRNIIYFLCSHKQNNNFSLFLTP